MGIDNDNTPAPSFREIESRYTDSLWGDYATNQFYGIETAEPIGITHRRTDNPKFAWPQQQHMDQSGRTYTVQRGYMRSLLTDPNVSRNSSVPNRRVFFQFNPLVLQREVQQSVGTMMPLLQDPAQLIQPVPGTTQFSFQLMFNREHEVNKGFDDPDQDWLTLPGSGQKALVSQIGVLADLMILDSITGQGLSQDMIEALVANTKRQYANYNTIVTNTKAADEKAGVDVEANAKDYRTVEMPKDEDEMKEIFNANIGNSAFLNPLPFRVMFSSLFMVEGVATGVSVSFNKFSKTMIPTQCVVTINMYALYLGFAKKKTFIYDNLIKAATDSTKEGTTDADTQATLDGSIGKFSGSLYKPTTTDFRFKIFGITSSDVVNAQIKSTKLKEVNINFSIEYKFTHTADGNNLPVTGTDTVALVQGGKSTFSVKSKNISDLTVDSTMFMDKLGRDQEGNLSPDSSTYYPYITFRIIAQVTGIGASGNTVTSQSFPTTTIKNYYWAEGITESAIGEFESSIKTKGSTANQGDK